jgi:glutamyl-tRNA synthetase
MQIEGVKLSKSKAQQEVKSGKYSGWDDPRTWSLQSLRRRGFQPHAIMDFIRSIGPNLTDITVPIETLYAFNRKLIDPVAHRYFFAPMPVKIEVQNAPKIKEIEVKLHPDNDKEMRKIKIGKSIFIPHEDLQKFGGTEIRLMHLYNIILNKKAKFTSEENKNIQKLQWVSDDNIKTSVLMPTGEIVDGLAESNTEKLKVGDIIQFERFGFVRLDKKENGKLLFVYAHN